MARHSIRLDRLLRPKRGVLHFRLLHPHPFRDDWGFGNIRDQSGDACALHRCRDFRVGGSADNTADRPARAQHCWFYYRIHCPARRGRGVIHRPRRHSAVCRRRNALGHYWDAENVVTIPAMVAKPEYRGTATGFAYVFVKLPAFLAIFLFPVLFSAIGQANATLFTAVFPLAGLLAALFILPEVYGYEQD